MKGVLKKKRKVKVLIVDDEKDMRDTFRDLLSKRGYEIASARDGYDAIRKVKDSPFDVIFVDMKMPGLTGYQTLKAIKEINHRAKVIIMTGYEVEALVRAALAEDAYCCIYKPFDSTEVFHVIDEALWAGRKKVTK